MFDFIDKLKASENVRSLENNGCLTHAGSKYIEAVEKHYCAPVPTKDDLSCNSVLRASSMGKFIFDLAYEHFYRDIKTTVEEYSERQTSLFFDGAAFEVWLYVTLIRLGYKVIAEEEEIVWEGIKGHIDFIVRDDEGRDFVVEAKCVSSKFFTRLERYDGFLRNPLSLDELSQDRGYLTQLAIYCEATGLPGFLIYKNKDNGHIGVMELVHGYAIPRLKRAKAMLKTIRSCRSFTDLYDHYPLPVPELEMYKRRVARWHDGTPKLFPHFYIHRPELIYKLADGETGYGKARKYVMDYNYPSTCINRRSLAEDFIDI